LADGVGRQNRSVAEGADVLGKRPPEGCLDDGALPASQLVALSGRASSPPPKSAADVAPSRRAFPLRDPHAVVRQPGAASSLALEGKWLRLASGAVFLVALLLVALPAGTPVEGRAHWQRTFLPLLLALFAGGLWLRVGRRRKAVDAAAKLRAESLPEVAAIDERALVLTADTVDLERARGERISLPMSLTLVGPEGGQRFGVTLLSNAKRDRLVAVLTSESGSMLFATNLGAEQHAGVAGLLARSTVVGGHDHALDAVAPDGVPTELEPAAFVRLLTELNQRDEGCFDRIILSDQHGAPLLLEGSDLLANDHHFDLSRPIEWRSILFQESFGTAVTLYQGTWVRQNGAEVVLVSLLGPSFFDSQTPDETRPTQTSSGESELDVHFMRDQRLAQATATDPPPTDQRVAIDGIFVLPMRAALDQAPRQSSRQARDGHP